jgi:hypothetical protein
MIQFIPTEPPQLLIEREGAYSIVVTLEHDLSELYFDLGCWIQSTDVADHERRHHSCEEMGCATFFYPDPNQTQPERETQHGNTDDDYKIHHRPRHLRRLGS